MKIKIFALICAMMVAFGMLIKAQSIGSNAIVFAGSFVIILLVAFLILRNATRSEL